MPDRSLGEVAAEAFTAGRRAAAVTGVQPDDNPHGVPEDAGRGEGRLLSVAWDRGYQAGLAEHVGG